MAPSNRTRGRGEPRPLVLCVDDEPVTLKLVERLLGRIGLDAEPVSGAAAALARFDERRPDLVITDIRMPGLDGLGLIHAIRERDVQVPIIVATGQATMDTAMRALREGATGMLIKPFTVDEFQGEVAAALDRARIATEALEYRFVTPILDGVALALTAAIEARHLETGEHCRELGMMGERIAGLMDLPERDRTTIRIGGYLHDVGKIAIADRILLKPGKLTDSEYREMQRHSELGAAIVQTHEAMRGIASIVRHHHERWDGAGYPDRLAAADIPVGARIIAVCDAFSAMTHDRVYRRRMPDDQAWEEVLRHSGRQFDPEIVERFGEILAADSRAGLGAEEQPVGASSV